MDLYGSPARVPKQGNSTSRDFDILQRSACASSSGVGGSGLGVPIPSVNSSVGLGVPIPIPSFGDGGWGWGLLSHGEVLLHARPLAELAGIALK